MRNLYLIITAFLLVGVVSSCSKTETEDRVNNDNFDQGDLSYTSDSNSEEYSGNMSPYSGSYTPPPTPGENYNEIVENPFVNVSDEAISTFSIDADGGSYSNARRFIENGNMPPADAIRTEEFVNFFNYDYPDEGGAHPIALNGEVSDCPWNTEHKLIRIGIKGKEMDRYELPPANFVLLVDVSGSMNSPNKLPLVVESMKLFVEEMKDEDRLSIVTYAGSSDVILESTAGTDRSTILAALDALSTGGGTNGADGLYTAYDIAEANYIEGGNNRIILATDGDFNIGIYDTDALIALIEEKRESGVFFTSIGVGSGNLNEGMLEQLANHGNGNFEYIDDIDQGRKVFVDEFAKFYTVAKDVKVQVEFNESVVSQYRLIGYENRLLETEDFEDDTKDAGEIGSGQSITALYELVMQENTNSIGINTFTIDFRYKLPDEDNSILMTLPIKDTGHNFGESSDNMRFAASTASYALLLRDSEYKGNTSYDLIQNWSSGASTFDPYGFKSEFIDLVEMTKGL